MKKYLLLLLLMVSPLSLSLLTSCSSADADKKIEAFNEYYNSDDFRKELLESGLFTEMKSEITDDGVVITFKVNPNLDLSKATETERKVNRENMISILRQGVKKESLLRDGLEGLKEKQQTLQIEMIDVRDNHISATINPADILE
jgi:hypothetical protein